METIVIPAPTPGLPTQLGRYTVLKHLAFGGMAEVLLARHDGIEGFERHVVLKRIRAEYANKELFVRMFLDEARVVASLHHQNIVQVTDIGESSGNYFFTMEHIHGADLRRILQVVSSRQQHLPIEIAVAIIAQAAAGLHYAHDKLGPDGDPLGLVHRDISLGNVLVGFDGSVKVVDFGIAKTRAPGLAPTLGGWKGKLAYMSPEQFRASDSEIDRRSDVYSLGVVLYELLTTSRLFTGSEQDIQRAVLTGTVVPAQCRRPEISIELSAIILRAMDLDPAKRFQTAGEMCAALQHLARTMWLTTSPNEIAAFLSRTLGDTAEPWIDSDRTLPCLFADVWGPDAMENNAPEPPPAPPPAPVQVRLVSCGDPGPGEISDASARIEAASLHASEVASGFCSDAAPVACSGAAPVARSDAASVVCSDAIPVLIGASDVSGPPKSAPTGAPVGEPQHATAPILMRLSDSKPVAAPSAFPRGSSRMPAMAAPLTSPTDDSDTDAEAIFAPDLVCDTGETSTAPTMPGPRELIAAPVVAAPVVAAPVVAAPVVAAPVVAAPVVAAPVVVVPVAVVPVVAAPVAAPVAASIVVESKRSSRTAPRTEKIRTLRLAAIAAQATSSAALWIIAAGVIAFAALNGTTAHDARHAIAETLAPAMLPTITGPDASSAPVPRAVVRTRRQFAPTPLAPATPQPVGMPAATSLAPAPAPVAAQPALPAIAPPATPVAARTDAVERGQGVTPVAGASVKLVRRPVPRTEASPGTQIKTVVRAAPGPRKPAGRTRAGAAARPRNPPVKSVAGSAADLWMSGIIATQGPLVK